MTLPARISLITLPVEDVARSRRFYEALGWRASSASQDSVAFFDLDGLVLALYGRASLAADLGEPLRPEGAGITLAQNQASEAEVDEALAAMVAAGGRLVRPAGRADWGGYIGYVADPDGHVWEIAFNPFWPLDEDGRIILPPPG
jgi:catechol 2,3-dioxygenase-like lactoylglutathione lyase family enzyme